MKHQTITNFLKCGLYGWGIECLFTGVCSFITKDDKSLKCKTSIWMFPIYGSAAFLKPMCRLCSKKNIIFRGSIYAALIYLTEYSAGIYLKRKKCCPWDYSDAKTNIDGVIRLDFAPLWFLVGLFYEHILLPDSLKKNGAK